MNLYVIYVGGKTATSLIEVHDIHFGIGETIEDTFAQLRQQWWGAAESLHLDAYGLLRSVENYNITLKAVPGDDSHQLYFVNLGGYDPGQFTELHKNMFVVAENSHEAKIKAKSTIKHWTLPHTDNLLEVENCVNVTRLLEERGIYLHLDKTDQPVVFDFTCNYIQIGKSDVVSG